MIKSEDLVEVPITLGIMKSEQVGSALLDTRKLPDTPDFCFALVFERSSDGCGYHPMKLVLIDDLDYSRLIAHMFMPTAEMLHKVMYEK